MNLEPAKKIIREFEGLRLQSYKCPAGLWTIGYGHTKNVEPKMICDKAAAESFLDYDIDIVMELINNVPQLRGLNDNQINALVSFIFNIGSSKFIKSTLYKKLIQGLPNEAAKEFDKWVYAGKKKLPGLVRRREAEKALFLKPVEVLEG